MHVDIHVNFMCMAITVYVHVFCYSGSLTTGLSSEVSLTYSHSVMKDILLENFKSLLHNNSITATFRSSLDLHQATLRFMCILTTLRNSDNCLECNKGCQGC